MPEPDDLTSAEAKQRLIKLAVRTPIFKFEYSYYNAESIIGVGSYADQPDATKFSAYVRFRGAKKAEHVFNTAEARNNFVDNFAKAWKEALSQLYE